MLDRCRTLRKSSLQRAALAVACVTVATSVDWFILVLTWRIVPTRVMTDMLPMQIIMRRNVVNGPKNIHGAIQ